MVIELCCPTWISDWSCTPVANELRFFPIRHVHYLVVRPITIEVGNLQRILEFLSQALGFLLLSFVPEISYAIPQNRFLPSFAILN